MLQNLHNLNTMRMGVRNNMRNIILTLEWELKGLDNGFIVNNKYFEELEDAKNHLKKQIDEECKLEWETEDED